MPISILKTKIHIPPLRRNLIARPHLYQKLNAGLNRKLTIISAPAGFGKTTLLCAWVQDCQYPVAWISLDEGDNDINRFYSHFVAALHTIPELKDAHVGETGLLALQSSETQSKELLITSLINDIVENIPPFAIILDDFHTIEATQVNEMLIFLVDNLPANMHVFLSGRADPPWPLSRLRVRDHLIDVRAEDLRFTLEEGEGFLNKTMDLGLSSDDVATLEARTEGWIAGLQMAALSMQGRKDKSDFIRSFSGSHRFVLDYLMEEVLKQQTAVIQEFLFKTSILERMTASLCDALTDRDDSHSVLAQMDRANLFLIPLDDERQWYRYHHLFADLLQQRLQQEQKYSVQNLHRQACAWYEKNQLIPDAIKHALKAKDFDLAADRIAQFGWEIFTRGEIDTVIRWITKLPRNILSTRPKLNVLYAWTLAKSGDLERVEACLQDIDSMRGEVAAIRAYVAGVRGHLPEAVELAQIALANLPEENLHMRAIITQNLGVAYHWSGDPIAATQTLSKAAELTRLADQKFQTMTTLAILGRAYEMQGNLRTAFEIYQGAINLASEAKQQPVPFAGMAYVGLAGPLYEWNNLDEAMYNAKEGVRLSEMGGFVAYQIFGNALLARINEAKGNHNQANKMLQKAEYLGRDSKYDLVMALVTDMRIRMWIRQKNFAAAEDWAKAHLVDSIDDLDAAGEIEQIVVAQVLVAQKKFDQALNLLDQLLDDAQAAWRMESVLKILTLQAVIFQSQQETNRALSVLEQALSLAEVEGYMRIFLDHGKPMEELLRSALTRGITPNYAAQLLEQTEAKLKLTQSLIEPLSERETEILRLIVGGLSNQEIAEELIIAESTVKTHINHIYAKLNVTSRTQSIAKARALKLL